MQPTHAFDTFTHDRVAIRLVALLSDRAIFLKSKLDEMPSAYFLVETILANNFGSMAILALLPRWIAKLHCRSSQTSNCCFF